MKSSLELENYSLGQGEQNFQRVEIIETLTKEETSFWQKFKVEKGSIGESVINLCIISFGIGLLALPQKVNYLTLIMTPILIIICGVINYWTFTVLGDASRKNKVNKYEDIVAALFNPCFYYFFNFVMMVGLFGVMILFQVILYKFIGGVINELFSYGYSNMENFLGRKESKIMRLLWLKFIYFISIMSIKNYIKNEIRLNFWCFFCFFNYYYSFDSMSFFLLS